MTLAILSRLLRNPEDIAAACREDRDVEGIAKASLLALAVGAMAFGAIVGSFRGGAQIAYAAVKIPLALVVTLAISVPAFFGIAAALGRPFPARSIVALSLAAAGRSALVLLAFTPIVWLLFDWGLAYHGATVVAALAYAVSSLAALGILVRGIGPGPGRFLVALAFVGVFFAVGGQSSWILRPYLVRPKTAELPFLRAREGSFADAVLTSSRSMFGFYSRDLEREESVRR